MRMLLSPPRSSPNISSARGNHLFTDFWIIGMVTSGLPSAARFAQRRIGITPAARWNASSRSIGGMLSAIGLYAHTFCMVSWYLPTRSMNAANTMLSTNESYSTLNASSTCEPVCMDRISSTISSPVDAARGRAPVLRQQQVEHLVAVPQLLGHHAQHPEAVLVVLRALERAGVLLDRAELGRGLRADDGQQVLRLVLAQLVAAARASSRPRARRPRCSPACRSPSWRTGRTARPGGSTSPSSRAARRSP